MAGANPARVLVIKLGALGDFVLAAGPFQAIRDAHPMAHITLLTTAPFADLARRSPWFDAVWVDDRPPLSRPDRWWALRRRLRAGRFDRVYDLQTSDRSGWYFRLMGPNRPDWSGIAPGCSLPHATPRRDFMHTLDRQADQLAMAGIAAVPPPDLSWVTADIARFGLAERFVLLVPGGAPHRPRKRWPVAAYGELARAVVQRGALPVVLGGPAEAALVAPMTEICPELRSLVGETGLADIAALARRAAYAVGNDTGPMHLIAAAGCPCTVLFSDESDPALTAPRGPRVTILRRPDLRALDAAEVVASLTLR